MGNGFCWLVRCQQDETQIVICIGVGRRSAEYVAKFLLSEIQLLLRDIEIAEIVFGSRRSGVQLECVPERVGCAVVIFLLDTYNAEKIVALDALWIFREDFLEFSLGFV
jgi:hypothetical protein